MSLATQMISEHRATGSRAPSGTLEGTDRAQWLALWRLLVAASGALGVWLAALQYDVWWTALSQLASVAVAVAYAGLAVHALRPVVGGESGAPWLRGMLANLMLLVSIAYLAMPRADLSDPYSVVEHLLTPALVVADFVFVGHRGRGGVRWWYPLTWLVPPAAYLTWYVLAELHVYADLDPTRPIEFVTRALMLLILVLGSGALVYAVDHRSPGLSSGVEV